MQEESEFYELNYEANLMNSFLSLASDLKSGVLNPTEVDPFINVKPNEIDIESLLIRLNDQSNITQIIYDFAPKTLEYTRLLLELEKLKKISVDQDWGDLIPENQILGFKLVHENVRYLRNRLYKMGYLTFNSLSNLYDLELKSAVQLFQADHGLNDDGVAGNYTIQALNIPPETRLMQVAVNLERIRWDNAPPTKKQIIVNQPNFHAYLFEDSEIKWQSRVVIGLPEHQTKEFTDLMTHMIVNPVWHVPRSISIEEYLPILQEDPEFLKDNDMRLIVRGTKKDIDVNLIDMKQFEPNNFPFEIKQNPSNINALGVVKFMFPNKYNIYMHDTPMKELFFKDERAFSHGCVRVQDPFQFAFQLLSEQENDPQGKFQKVLNTKQETQINLVEAIPIKIVYRTVFFGDYGQPQYRADVYGRDALVYMSLSDAGVST